MLEWKLMQPVSTYYKSPLTTLKTELRLRGYSKKTIDSYVYHNEKFQDFVNKSVLKVTTKDIKRYIKYLIEAGYNKNSINLAISALMFYFKKILRRRFHVPRLKKDSRLYLVLSKDEVKRIINSITNIKHKLLIEILYSTGLRVSECVNLKVLDFDFSRNIGYVRYGKGKKDRIFCIASKLKNSLTEYLKDRKSGYLFKTSSGHYSIRTAQLICKKYARLADVHKNVTPHTFRRSFATHLIEQGTSIFKVQKLLGHSYVSTTQRYISGAKTDVEDIINPLDEL